MRRRSFSDFPKNPSAFLHPERSLVVVRPHKTSNSRVLCLLIVPTPGTLCVSFRVLRHSLLRHSSSNRARASTGASCTTKMRSFFFRASPLEASQPFLCPSFFCCCSRCREDFWQWCENRVEREKTRRCNVHVWTG